VSSGRRGIATKPCVLRAAVDLGVNHIDTAQYYGPGAVSDLIGEALYPYPNDLAIVSKVAVRRDIADPVSPFGEQHELRQGIEDNLATLGTSRLAAVNLRMMDASAPTTFIKPKDRDNALGIYGAIAGARGAVGLLLAGALTEYLSWR